MLPYRDGPVNFNKVLATLTAQLGQLDLLTLTRGTVGTDLVAPYKAVGVGLDPSAKRTLADFVPVAIQEQMGARTEAWRKGLPAEASSEASQSS